MGAQPSLLDIRVASCFTCCEGCSTVEIVITGESLSTSEVTPLPGGVVDGNVLPSDFLFGSVLAKHPLVHRDAEHHDDKHADANSDLAALAVPVLDNEVVLLKGSWLVELSHTRGVLPRRQQLPAAAVWSPREFLQRAFGQSLVSVPVVAISYCWLSREHADPRGEQLQVLGAALAQWISFHDDTLFKQQHPWDVAVFLDWCSLYQQPLTDLERQARSRSLERIQLWYAHEKTWVWLLTRVPLGAKPFAERGWPTFERSVCHMMKSSEMVLDLGSFDQRCKTWITTRNVCRTRCRPPLAPAAFGHLMQDKFFTVREDQKFLVAKYAETFSELLVEAEYLDFSNQGWGDGEIQILVEPLKHCRFLRGLSLNMNVIGDVGAEKLSEVLTSCQSLERLSLTGNHIGDVGASHLATIVKMCPQLEALSLEWNQIGDMMRVNLLQLWLQAGKAAEFLDL